MKNKKMLIKKTCVAGVMSALYFVLDYFATSVSLVLFGDNIKISPSGLPVILSALIAGPVFGAATGFVGAFLGQMISYGFTATTLLWVLPATARGLIMGLLFIAFKKSTKPYIIVAETLISSIFVTALNTLAMFVDSKLNHYYSYAYVFGGIGIRVVTSLLTAVILAIIAIPIIKAVKKSKFIE